MQAVHFHPIVAGEIPAYRDRYPNLPGYIRLSLGERKYARFHNPAQEWDCQSVLPVLAKTTDLRDDDCGGRDRGQEIHDQFSWLVSDYNITDYCRQGLLDSGWWACYNVDRSPDK